jgi:hypothetical protein
MRITSANSRHFAAGLASLSIVAIIPSAAEASVSVVDDESLVVTVVDEGNPAHRVLLGSPPAPGTLADSTTDYDVDMSVSVPSLDLALDVAVAANMTRTTEVITVEADAGYSARETFTSFNQAVSSAEATDTELMGLDPAVTADFGPLVDVPLIVVYGPTGVPVSADVEAATATPEQDESAALLVDNGLGTEAFTTSFPSTPVGQGAVWTVAESASSASTIVPLTMRFTLVTLKGDDYTIEIGLEGDILDQLAEGSPGVEVVGEATLTGTLTGNAANRLDQQLSMDVLMDVTATEDGEAVDLDIAMSIDHSSTPR